jgi:dCMP deaminase
MSKRESKNLTFLKMAKVLSAQATCVRRSVGCIFTDVNNVIIASGYNGNAKELQHCLDVPCAGAGYSNGQGLDVCEAIHAEQNAILMLKNTSELHTCYTTTSPCPHCLKMLLNTGCQRIVFSEAHASAAQSEELWRRTGRAWVHLPLEEDNSPVYRAIKQGGSYQARGTVISTFTTLQGKQRAVFEFDTPRGMLHILSPDQLERLC